MRKKIAHILLGRKKQISRHHLLVFNKEEEVSFVTEEDTRILFLSAEPIEESIAAKDNFVRNTLWKKMNRSFQTMAMAYSERSNFKNPTRFFYD